MRGERSWGMGCASAGRVKGAWRHWGSQLERCKTRIAKSGAGAGFAREVLTWVRGRRPRTPGPRHVHVALGRDVYEASPLPPLLRGSLGPRGAAGGLPGAGLRFLGIGGGLFAQGSAVPPGVGCVCG